MSRRKRTRRDKIEENEILERKYNPNPLVAKNQKQKDYIKAIRNMSIVIATGFAGTSKTYIPSRMAAQMFSKGEIDRIILSRPATSKSKSVGFFAGSKCDKMKEWLRPVTEAMRDDLLPSEIEYMIKHEQLDFVPLETIKGNSWKNSFIIVDEAEDCTFPELEHIMTRVGENSTMVLAGDIHQTDLRESGLKRVIDEVLSIGNAYQHISYIDFSNEEDIVRSEACKDITLSFHMVKHKEVQ